MKLEFNLPRFPGFYHSIIDPAYHLEGMVGSDPNHYYLTEQEYNQVDWEQMQKLIAQDYLEYWIKLNQDVLTKYGIEITYKAVDSPREYNFRSDNLVCIATFKSLVIRNDIRDAAKNDIGFQNLIRERHTGRSGFVSFYSNNPGTWATEYTQPENFDNVIFETWLMHRTEELTTESEGPNLWDVVERIIENIQFK
ncbi:hypothetical protein GCM10027051_31420 [Niabella terrae]